MPTITSAPAYLSDRHPLVERLTYDFDDYRFSIVGEITQVFEIVPIVVTDDEAFLFLFPQDDILENRYSLFNLHAFLRYSGSLEEFAHSRGPSVSRQVLSPYPAFNGAAIGYDRLITMAALFEGAESVIDFIGGKPDLLVRDSHIYFEHKHNHYYSGMIHPPGDEARYDMLRQSLFRAIRLV